MIITMLLKLSRKTCFDYQLFILKKVSVKTIFKINKYFIEIIACEIVPLLINRELD